MNQWSIEILRQGGWDLWTWLCIGATLVLAVQAYRSGAMRPGGPRLILALAVLGLAGTGAICALPALQRPMVGLVWTPILLGMVSAGFYLPFRSRLGTRRMNLLLALRIAAVALLVMMFFEPVLRTSLASAGSKPAIFFLIDDSGSMSVADSPGGPSRIQSVWQVLRPLLGRIDEHFAARYVKFDADAAMLKSATEVGDLRGQGKSTHIGRAIETALAQASPPLQDDAQAILISDGIDADGPRAVGAATASRRRIDTITVGSPQTTNASLTNLSVQNLSSNGELSVGLESKITATIAWSGPAAAGVDAKMAEVSLNDDKPGEIQTSHLALEPGDKRSVEFTYRPTSAGPHRIAVWVDPVPGEISTLDNRAELTQIARETRLRVLYVEGRVRPEYKYLNRLLSHDPDIDLSTLLRLQANRFVAASGQAEQKLTELPSTPAGWRSFDVIVLGDLDSSFVASQAGSIEQAVADGAGLLMIGGKSSFGGGGYAGSAIEKALPVQVGTAGSDGSAAMVGGDFVPQLTVDGQDHPILQGLSAWLGGSDGRRATRPLPELAGCVLVGPARTGAQILLVDPQAAGSAATVLAVQRYGRGRSAAFTADSTYRWQLELAELGADNPYPRFWGQLIRWLGRQDTRGRAHQEGASVAAFADRRTYSAGENIRIRAIVRDEHGQSTSAAQVGCRFLGSEASPTTLIAVEGAPGLYEATLPRLEVGNHPLSVSASMDGKELGNSAVKLDVENGDDELLNVAANAGLMVQIAQASGGEAGVLTDLPAMLERAIGQTPADTASSQTTLPLDNLLRDVLAAAGHAPDWQKRYDLPMQGAMVAVLLGLEWGLRRRWELP